MKNTKCTKLSSCNYFHFLCLCPPCYVQNRSLFSRLKKKILCRVFSKLVKYFCSFLHNEFLNCFQNIGYHIGIKMSQEMTSGQPNLLYLPSEVRSSDAQFLRHCATFALFRCRFLCCCSSENMPKSYLIKHAKYCNTRAWKSFPVTSASHRPVLWQCFKHILYRGILIESWASLVLAVFKHNTFRYSSVATVALMRHFAILLLNSAKLQESLRVK